MLNSWNVSRISANFSLRWRQLCFRSCIKQFMDSLWTVCYHLFCNNSKIPFFSGQWLQQNIPLVLSLLDFSYHILSSHPTVLQVVPQWLKNYISPSSPANSHILTFHLWSLCSQFCKAAVTLSQIDYAAPAWRLQLLFILILISFYG